ncbi:Ser/Thr protein kinase RdoA (MazF antagonist) [Neisseria sp. HSC-16F19]|nr:phosphotransferase [Neisseria sp. HSC-16F19]MCP2039614.1 Ser/Thr protein kinase RdoA (MazF antagonist) [Neisseria sp. HSC-16F19]
MAGPHTSTEAPHNFQEASKVLMQAVPDVSLEESVQLAHAVYGWTARAEWLSGERDKNVLLHVDDGRQMVLKFINAAETAAETDVQVQVLHWLARVGCPVTVPVAVPTQAGDAVYHHIRHDGTALAVRAYSFLPGTSVAQAAMNDDLQYSFGRTAAQLVQALAGFNHTALERVLLWDVMHIGQLLPWAEQILPEDDIKALILQFLPRFAANTLPALQSLPQQVIHGDLSRSNTVLHADAPGKIAGVLDFGDLSYGPRILELAIAASYAMDENQAPQPALARLVAGYQSILPLNAQETALLPHLILARWLQRIIISEWRAAQFPENKTYIMRSNAQARRLALLCRAWWSELGYTAA